MYKIIFRFIEWLIFLCLEKIVDTTMIGWNVQDWIKLLFFSIISMALVLLLERLGINNWLFKKKERQKLVENLCDKIFENKKFINLYNLHTSNRHIFEKLMESIWLGKFTSFSFEISRENIKYWNRNKLAYQFANSQYLFKERLVASSGLNVEKNSKNIKSFIENFLFEEYYIKERIEPDFIGTTDNANWEKLSKISSTDYNTFFYDSLKYILIEKKNFYNWLVRENIVIS